MKDELLKLWGQYNSWLIAEDTEDFERDSLVDFMNYLTNYN